MAELEADRASIAAKNFPEAKVFVGDIWETKKELADFLNKNWNDKTPNEKNKAISDWDNTSCDNQNSLYTMFVEGRQKRDTVDKLAK